MMMWRHLQDNLKCSDVEFGDQICECRDYLWVGKGVSLYDSFGRFGQFRQQRSRGFVFILYENIMFYVTFLLMYVKCTIIRQSANFLTNADMMAHLPFPHYKYVNIYILEPLLAGHRCDMRKRYLRGWHIFMNQHKIKDIEVAFSNISFESTIDISKNKLNLRRW